MQLDIQPAQSDFSRLFDLIMQRPTKLRSRDICEFMETTVVARGKYKGLPFRLDRSPYMRRPFECASPQSPIQQIFAMWPTQVGKSAYAQGVVGYYGKEEPTEIIYATSDLKQAKKIMWRSIEPIFKSIGVEFRTSSENRSSRRTGDVTYSKEFDGGNLDVVTANSTADLASETKRVGIGDEVGKWKATIGDEGSPWGQLYTRLKQWKDEKKAIAISSPTDVDTCLMYALFLTGTQEIWEVPCPHCAGMQNMDVKPKTGYGLDWKMSGESVVRSSIVYVCKHCSKSFNEHKNFEIQQHGIWTPQAKPIDEYTVSFNLHVINSIFESWYEIAKKYEAARYDLTQRKEYNNFFEGLPFKFTGSRPKSEKIIKNRGTYKSGTVPDGVLYLNASVDVQRGAEKWEDATPKQLEHEIKMSGEKAVEQKFPRLELEVMGTGPGYRTWSIDYRVFFGKVENAFAGAWELLNQWALSLIKTNGVFGFNREKDGHAFPIVLTLVDSGYDASLVYTFTQRWTNTYPSKGLRTITKEIKNPLDIEKKKHRDDFKRYSIAKVGPNSDIVLYEIGTKHYKQRIYNNLNIERIDKDIQAPGFQDFPRDYTTRYFDMLTAEEKLTNGEYDNMGRPNEALDCRVMNAAGADIYLDSFTQNLKLWYKSQGMNAVQLQQIDHKLAIREIARGAKIDNRYLEVN